MATLFDRLVLFPESGDPDESHISVQAFTGLLRDVASGYVTRAEMVAALGLTDTQASQLDAFIGMLAQHARPRELADVVFIHLAIGEQGILPEKYQSQVALVSRITAEIAANPRPA